MQEVEIFSLRMFNSCVHRGGNAMRWRRDKFLLVLAKNLVSFVSRVTIDDDVFIRGEGLSLHRSKTAGQIRGTIFGAGNNREEWF